MKDKIVNFLLIFLSVYIVLSFFNNNDKTQTSENNIIISPIKTNYTIPASIKINIKNNTTQAVKLNTCDLKIKSSAGVIDLGDKNFCKDLNILSNKNEIINLSPYFAKFEMAGDYFIETKIAEKDYMSKFVIENKGFFNKFFTFFFYAPFYNLIAFLLSITGYSLFWTIILITVIIRSLLIYPQHHMMVSQAKMQKIQPKIKEIQDKHKGDHQTLGVELMNLYKQEQVNPMGSCLPLLIQMPILIVVYNILVSIQDPVNTYYIYSFLQNFAINSIQTHFYFLNLLSIGGLVGGILAITVGIIQFIQIKLSLSYQKKDEKKNLVIEKKKGSSEYDMSSFMPNQDFMNKFMLYGMPIMITIFTFTFYVGIGIYWGISTIFMIFQQLVVNKILKKSS
ncbi:MAG: YidC/Oxa1 family membrane protein insertase [Candidatus Gracilibacteria bacterium]|nr:YidC/Oxa1 family membrane protein insertase [Candidatus Gracilibacteria bacterium]